MLENAHLSEGVAVAKQRVTIADVAREAGTSTASVSYYLNDKREKLSEKTQTKIARVIKELGYVPNAQAQTLTGKQTHVIAIIILDNTNKWAGLVLNGMEQVMLPAGYQTVVCTSNFNPETELMYVDKMLSLGVDGFIIQPTANFKAVHDRIRRAGKPVVFFDAAIYSQYQLDQNQPLRRRVQRHAGASRCRLRGLFLHCRQYDRNAHPHGTFSGICRGISREWAALQSHPHRSQQAVNQRAHRIL